MPYFEGRYLTDREVEQLSRELDDEERDIFRSNLRGTKSDSSFIDSALIAGATDSALLGGIIGGELLGGIVGGSFLRLGTKNPSPKR